MSEEVMTLVEVCKYLSLSESTLYRMVYAKKIPCIKVGKLHRFRKVDIDKWLADKKPVYKVRKKSKK